MKAKNLIRFVAIAIAVIASTTIHSTLRASTFTWTNSTSGAFNDANNWDPTSGPPTTGDTAVFDQTGSHVVNITADTPALASMVVTNSATHTIDLNDGTARTYDAGALTWWSNGSLILTDAGTLLTGVNNVNFGNAGGFSLVVTNGATWRHQADVYGYGGPMKVTGPGSKIVVQSGAGIYLANGPQFVTVDDAARIETPGPFVLGAGTLTVGGGSGISTMRVASAQFHTYNYAAADAFIKNNGILELTTGGLEVRDGYFAGSGGQSGISEFTMEGGKVTISPNQVIGLRNIDMFAAEPLHRGTLRGTGVFQRVSAGTNFRVENEGYLMPGDTATPNLIGTLTFDGGSLFQTNVNQQGAGIRFDFNSNVAGSADLLDFTGGTITITAGTNLFTNAGAGTLAYGQWNFLLADDITYSPSFDNMSAILAGLDTPLDSDIVSFGVVAFEGGEALQLSVSAIPEPSTALLFVAGGLLLWRRRKGRLE